MGPQHTVINLTEIALTIELLILSFLSYKSFYPSIVTKIGIYSLILLELPFLWYSQSSISSLIIGYTLLIFTLCNFLTQKRERILVNIIGLIHLQIFFIFFNKTDFFTYSTTIMFIFLLIFIIVILTYLEKSYENERKHSHEKEEKLISLARVDFLTGLYNRNYMEQKLKSVHNIWIRGIQHYSLIMLDIDYFKSYNDFYGHVKGDECLKKISSILQNELPRDTDYAFRYGGEEFLIILSFTNNCGALQVANRIKKEFKKP